jgi:hypothetical protein
MTTASRAVAFSVDPWDPGYGVAFGDDNNGGALDESSAELDLDLEVPAAQWRPLSADPAVRVPETLLFLDGVRRIDARVWTHGGNPLPSPGIAASFAAGLVSCNEAAHVIDVTVERGLFTADRDAPDIVTRFATYQARIADAPGLDQLSLALQRRLTAAEADLAARYRARHPGDNDLLVVDGPLRGRGHLERTVGYIKTHHSSYLPTEQVAVVSALAPGQRTPAFKLGTSWRRTSWYLRLPGAAGVPWSGVVRLECSADLPAEQVIWLADLSATLLVPLASSPYKDPRAPQNLVPIGGLERDLRRRLGDQQLLYRGLRTAALNTTPSPPSGG